MEQWSCWHGVAKGPGDQAAGLGAYLVLLERTTTGFSLPATKPNPQHRVLPHLHPPWGWRDDWAALQPRVIKWDCFLCYVTVGKAHTRGTRHQCMSLWPAPSLAAKPSTFCWERAGKMWGDALPCFFPWAPQAHICFRPLYWLFLTLKSLSCRYVCVAHPHLSQVWSLNVELQGNREKDNSLSNYNWSAEKESHCSDSVGETHMASDSSEIEVMGIIWVAMGYPGVKYSPPFKAEELTLGVSIPEKMTKWFKCFVNT